MSSQMKTSSQSHPVSSESAMPPLLIVPYIHDSLSGGKEASSAPHNSLWSVLVSSAAVRLGSVGAGGDGVVQLDVQGRRGSLQAAETRITHATGLKQLLAWHRDLLITTAGTEHIPTIPAVMFSSGQPESSLTAIALSGQMIRVPPGHLSVLLVHLLPAGLREEFSAAAGQTVGLQVEVGVCD